MNLESKIIDDLNKQLITEKQYSSALEEESRLALELIKALKEQNEKKDFLLQSYRHRDKIEAFKIAG